MEDHLPTDTRLLRETVRGFVRETLLPLERGKSADPQAARRALGLWGLSVPAAHGGLGLTWRQQAAVSEELHRSPLGVWQRGLFHLGEVPEPLYQVPDVLGACLEGKRLAHQVIASAGQFAAQGGRLTGTLPMVPRFLTEDLLLVVLDDTGYLCDAATPGFDRGPSRNTMGSVELVDLTWNDALVPAHRIVPGIGEAARRWQARLQATVLAAGAVGAAQRCLEDALEYVKVRQTFGRPLAERQAIQWMIADSARELHAARLLVQRACAVADAGQDPTTASLRAKVYATTVATGIIDRVMQMHGAYGYSQDLPFEAYWRELRFYAYAQGENRALLTQEAAALIADLNR